MCQLIKEQHRLKLDLSEPERERLTLEEALRHHPHADVRERAAALLKVAEGRSPHWVARHGLLRPRAPDSVYQWLHFYVTQGLAGLLHRRHGGAHRSCL